MLGRSANPRGPAPSPFTFLRSRWHGSWIPDLRWILYLQLHAELVAAFDGGLLRRRRWTAEQIPEARPRKGEKDAPGRTVQTTGDGTGRTTVGLTGRREDAPGR